MNMKKIFLTEAVVCLAILVGVMAWRAHRVRSDFPAQQIVDDFVALQPTFDHALLARIMRIGADSGGFDINDYFTVLDALHPHDGLVLDWAYRSNGLGGKPVLYARERDAPRFVGFEDYVAHVTHSVDGRATGETEPWQGGSEYIEHIHAERTPEGFFQLVVLRLLGDRFHLYWHELYNETSMVCSRQGWEAVLREQNERGECYDPPAPDFIAATGDLDFSPRVRIGLERTEVNVTTYGPFRGLDLHYFVISTKYPHKILTHGRKSLLSHCQNFVF